MTPWQLGLRNLMPPPPIAAEVGSLAHQLAAHKAQRRDRAELVRYTSDEIAAQKALVLAIVQRGKGETTIRAIADELNIEEKLAYRRLAMLSNEGLVIRRVVVLDRPPGRTSFWRAA